MWAHFCSIYISRDICKHSHKSTLKKQPKIEISQYLNGKGHKVLNHEKTIISQSKNFKELGNSLHFCLWNSQLPSQNPQDSSEQKGQWDQPPNPTKPILADPSLAGVVGRDPGSPCKFSMENSPPPPPCLWNVQSPSQKPRQKWYSPKTRRTTMKQ